MELKEKEFDADKDFPDYDHFRGTNYNLEVIKKYIDKAISMGLDTSVFKGLKTREISKVYLCMENGMPPEKALDFASEFNRMSDLERYFQLKKKGVR